ncbi:hypothetical protein AAFF_G00189440 [Aldrovandia affinis]|uniref:Uncharacterized protein n=1 Tax=Aldrovandia affinis TaxID=143900 RepID=A0AAD7RJD9_9TELE|nr:hypothetical protein AAFF_G00189440 [Aldrovandia affinis]
MIITKIEAKEACDWLRGAGFPQYAQLFKDCRFPIDIDWVKSDHMFLDKDAIDSLCRRLNTLNKCMEMKLETNRSRRRSEEEEEEEPCAISTKWSFERQSRRWSRLEGLEFLPSPNSPRADKSTRRGRSFHDGADRHEVSSLHSSSSTESDGTSPLKAAEEPENSRSSSRCSFSYKPTSLESSFSGPPSPSEIPSFHSEERILEKPPWKRGQSLLRKMEKLRLRGTTQRPPSHGGRAKVLISGPLLQEGFDEEKLKRFNCVELSEMRGDSGPPSFSPLSGSGSSSSGSPSDGSSTFSTPSPVNRVRSHCRRATPQNQGHTHLRVHIDEQDYQNEKNHLENVIFQVPQGHKPGTFPMALSHNVLSPIDNTSVNWRTGSFHGYRGRRCQNSTSKDHSLASSPLAALDKCISIYDNVPGVPAHIHSAGDALEIGEDDVFSALDNVMERISGLQQLVTTWTESLSDDGDSDSANNSALPCLSSPNDIHLEIKKHEEADHSMSEGDMENYDQASKDLKPTYVCYSGEQSSIEHRRQNQLQWTSKQSLHPEPPGTGIEGQSASHINLLQKLSLLKLTALMDKYSPSSKQGWNWTVPKTMRKTKAPDSKDKRVFGVPLLLSVQQIGSPLPRSILKAMHYLRTECLDQVGLFRKSGVKSRIQSLREMVEADPDGVSYEGQSAFDVADLVKQYFRDLPEPIFSSKLCESFLHIYQYFPKDQQFSAAQAAIFLLPDENREALQALLVLLRDVVACAEENQMTPTNVAVCLAPSLFHLNTLKRDSTTTSRSSHRKYSLGRPDQRDLSENLAATQGLAHMVAESSRLFQVPQHWLIEKQSSLSDEILHSDVSENELDKRTLLDFSIRNVLREAREKFRSWASCSSSDHIDLAFKKMEDGHPLRLWKAVVEVEASPEEVLHRVLREHRLWERDLQHCQVVETLDKDAEVYQYTLQGMGLRPPQDHVVLRTWQRDPSSATIVLAAVSTEHLDALPKGVRAHVLTCFYLMETLGLRRTRLTHIDRTDTGGRSPEWYNKLPGHLLSLKLGKIRDSFKPDMKETKI